ncbi:palmitoyltransferase for Vac8p [Coemansia thaxteri]|uniref:Palmitoyltransferase n=1 Tax=Coemansia thaxteri TaxID=2663907 RepID=A0A9W8BHX0_9FUNG|nr:palmitoyltransferase for Vac8p [Coemansia thaxteri]
MPPGISFSWSRHRVFRALGFFPVVLTLGLLFWSVVTYALGVIPTIGRHSWLFASVCVAATAALWLLTMWCYIICVFRNPGAPTGLATATPADGPYSRVPILNHAANGASLPASRDSASRRSHASRRRYADDDSDVSDSGSECSDGEGPLTEEQFRRAELVYSITVRDNGQPRYCHKCNGPKPDRTHHCSVCGVCVLKMDHHCPWLNNCVGFRTQKAFVLFLVYGALYCTLLAATSALFYLYSLLNMSDDTELDLNLLIMIVLCIAFALSLMMFAGYSIYLLLTNTTTIESYEENNYRVQASQRSNGSRSKYVNLFDMGYKRNFTQVFGSVWYTWLVPTSTTVGDGVRFPISFEGYNELRQNID